MEGAPSSNMVREAVKDKVRELSTISRDLEQLTRQLSAAVSTVQVGFLKDRVDQLTVTQRRLIGEIADACPDAQVRSDFDRLDSRLESVRREVKEARASDELDQLSQEIDPLVERWADMFRHLVVVTIGAE